MGNNFVEFIVFFRNRPQMVLVGDINFNSLLSFFIGYINGINEFADIDLNRDISQWLNKKINQDSSLFWAEHFIRYYSELNEEELSDKLFEIMEEYFRR